MIKRFKKGFSLAELLISIGIIGIIASIGISISKIGIEKAYRLYYYTGYVGISNAIGEAISNGNPPVYATSIRNTAFANYVRDVLGAKDSSCVQNAACFKAPNGISYTIKPISTTEDASTGVSEDKYLIRMEVPQQRGTRQNGTCFNYYYNGKFDFLVPLKAMPSSTSVSHDYAMCKETDTISLQNRIDLLPFYLQDGTSGKLIVPYNSETPRTYKRKQFMPFQEAYCTSKIGREHSDTSLVDCTLYKIVIPEPTDALIQVASPSEVK